MPRLRTQINDFEVEEVPLYLPCGEGEHTFLWIEKRGIDTEAVTRDLARELRLERLAIGYAGRKDRWAVTRQWISVPRLAPAVARELAGPSWRVLDAVSHRHKLRTGDLVGNRFRVVVRGLDPAAAASAVERIAEISRRGLTNRFGRQRFGRDGDNAAAGAAVLRGGRFRGDRRHARFLVSALQSALFNQVLERRPAPPWQLLDGDLAVVHHSGGLFAVPVAAVEAARADALEISPTGPIFGAKMRSPAGAVAELEDQVWREQDLGSWRDLSPPRGLSVDGTRRALRVPVGGAAARVVGAERLDDEEIDAAAGTGGVVPGAGASMAIELRFELPAGSYATVLVEELFPGAEIEEGPPDREHAAGDTAASDAAPSDVAASEVAE